MIIEETSIPDSILDNSSASKILLADVIIEAFTPLFSEEIEDKKQRLKNSKSDYLKLKNVVEKTTTDLKSTVHNIGLQKKINSILEEIDNLLNQNVLYGKNKSIVSQILLSLDRLGDSELSKTLSILKKMEQQHVSRVIK